MKIKGILGIIILLVIGVTVWRLSPGLRTRARSTVDRAGEWSEESRLADPIGFIDFAEGRLEKHLASLKSGRTSIRNGLARIEAETKRNNALLGKAGELGAMFRTSFQVAEKEGSFPVNIAGSSYSRPELIEQVRLVLLQSTNYGSAVEGLAAAREAAQDADVRLLRQVTDTQAALAALPAKREIVRVNQLAGEVQQLLTQIDALIDQNETVLEGTPVRTVEELLAGTAATPPEADVDVMAFLEGVE